MATVQPIKSTAELDRVRAVLTSSRDRALFEFAVGTGFRGGDALGLRIKDVQHRQTGDALTISEQKTGKVRQAHLNALVAHALATLCVDRLKAGAQPSDWLFVSHSNGSQGGNRPLTTTSLSRMWADWCRKAGLDGLYGAHSGRKAFGYLARVEDGLDIAVVQRLYGHSSTRMTEQYICVQPDELRSAYMKTRTNQS